MAEKASRARARTDAGPTSPENTATVKQSTSASAADSQFEKECSNAYLEEYRLSSIMTQVVTKESARLAAVSTTKQAARFCAALPEERARAAVPSKPQRPQMQVER